MRLFGAHATVAALLACTEAHAEPLRASLEVESAPEAATCPGRARIESEVEAILGRDAIVASSDAGSASVRFSVRIEPDGPRGLVAFLESRGARTGERTFLDEDRDCKVIAQSLAITLAMTLDESPPKAPDPTVALGGREIVSSAATGEPWWRRRYLLPAIDAPPPKVGPDEAIPPLTASLGPLFDCHTLAGSTPGLIVRVDTYVAFLTFGFAFIYLPFDDLEAADFTADYSYAGARVRACVRSPQPMQFGLALCARASAGRRVATLSRGAIQVAETDGALVTLGMSTEISRRIVGPLGLFAELGVDGGAYRDRLDLDDGRGQSVRLAERPVGVEASLGLRFWLEPPEPDPPPEEGEAKYMEEPKN